MIAKFNLNDTVEITEGNLKGKRGIVTNIVVNNEGTRYTIFDKYHVENIEEENLKLYNKPNEKERFTGFTKELAILSMKYGITIQAIGGVNIFEENELLPVEYDNDYTSGDLIPYIK